MISMFGIISVVVALISIAIIVLHNRVMIKRAPVDTYSAALEDLLRQRIEVLIHACRIDTELYALCHKCVDLDLYAMAEALPDIDRACVMDLHEEDDDTEEYAPVDWEWLTDNSQAIEENAAALNQAIEEYNNLVTGSIAGRMMALILGMTAEEPL